MKRINQKLNQIKNIFKISKIRDVLELTTQFISQKLTSSYLIFRVLILMTTIQTINAQTFITTQGTNVGTGNSLCSGWQTQIAGGTWTNVMSQTTGFPNWNLSSAVSNNLYRKHSISNQNFVWGGTGTMTHYKITFDRKKSDCKRVYIQLAGDDIFSLRLNGSWVFQSFTGSSAQVNYQDLTDKVKCGVNEIYVAVNNTNAGPHYFMGILELGPEIRKLSSNNITHTSIECGKSVILNSPTIEGTQDVTYEWTGPSGTVLGTNYSLNLRYPNPSQNGKYKVKITSECCVYEREINLVFPDCDKCDAELITTRKDCYTIEAKVKSKFVNIKCLQFQINGVNISANESNIATIPLKPGKNKVCVLYWGNVYSNQNRFCCNEICKEIEVPKPDTLNIDTTYCNMPELNNTSFKFNPCLNAPAGTVNYTYFNSTVQYGVMLTGDCSFPHLIELIEGEYEFKYYDVNGCLLRVLKIKVTKKDPDQTYCRKIVFEPCGQNIDPNSVTPAMFSNDGDCNECYLTYLNSPTPVETSMLMYNGAPIYYKVYSDVTNCKKCYFIFEIKKLKCDINVDFDIEFTGIPGQYNLINKTTGVGTPLNGTWKIHGSLTPEISFQVETPTMTKHLDIGVNIICLTFTYTYCGEICTKTICKTYLIKEDGSFELLPELAPPMNQNNSNEISIEELINEINTKTNKNSNNNLNGISPIQDSEKVTPAKLETIKLQINPNPTASVFKVQPIDGSFIKYSKIEIMTTKGEVIISFSDVDSNKEFDLINYSDEMYIIRVIINNQWQNLKVIKSQN